MYYIKESLGLESRRQSRAQTAGAGMEFGQVQENIASFRKRLVIYVLYNH